MSCWKTIVISVAMTTVAALPGDIWEQSIEFEQQNVLAPSIILTRAIRPEAGPEVVSKNVDTRRTTMWYTPQYIEHERPTEARTLNETGYTERARFTKRMIGGSSSLSLQTSSKSPSGVTDGVKQKTQQRLPSTNLVWGETTIRTTPESMALARKATNSAASPWSHLSSKRKSWSSKNMLKGPDHVASDSESNGRNSPSTWQKSQTPTTEDDAKRKKLRSYPKTPKQRKRQAQYQKKAREKQKLEIEAGDPQAIKKRQRYNAKRREQWRERRGYNRKYIPDFKGSAHDRELSKNRSALYRARQKGEAEPREFRTSEEHRAKERERMRIRRERLRNEEQVSVQPKLRQKKKSTTSDDAEWLDMSENSESEWRNFRLSPEPRTSLSHSAASRKKTTRHDQSDRMVPTVSRQQSREMGQMPAQSLSRLTQPRRQSSLNLYTGSPPLALDRVQEERDYGASEGSPLGSYGQENKNSAPTSLVGSSQVLQHQRAVPSRADSPVLLPDHVRVASPASFLHSPQLPNTPSGSTLSPSLGQLQDATSNFAQAGNALPTQSHQSLNKPMRSEEPHWWNTPPMSPLSPDSIFPLDPIVPNKSVSSDSQ